MSHLQINGFEVFKGFINRAQQEKIVTDVSQSIEKSPLFRPTMPRSGRPFSVRMGNLGEFGWISDKSGYRYQKNHPETGLPWLPIPASVKAVWNKVSGYGQAAEACLVNYYDNNAKMGMHRDQDEADLTAPVVSISLGDTAIFRMGGAEKKGPTKSIKLESGDVVVIGGSARLFYHGIDRVLGGSSSLLKSGGRLNLTLRRVT